MKIVCLPLFLLLPLFSCLAQDAPNPVPEKVPGKWELGIHISPVLPIAMGLQPSAAQPFGVMGKRVFGPIALRFGYDFRFRNQTEIGLPEPINESFVRTTAREEKRREHGIRLGAEYRVPVHKGIEAQLGLDLWVAHRRIDVIHSKTEGYLEQATGQGTLNPGFRLSNQTLTWTMQGLEFSQIYGMVLTGGVIVPLGKRFYLSGQGRMDFYIQDSRTDVFSFPGFSRQHSQTMAFDFNGFLSELSVYYRF